MTIEMIFLHFVLFFTDLLCKKNSTVKIMILSRYRNRRVTVFKSSFFMVARSMIVTTPFKTLFLLFETIF